MKKKTRNSPAHYKKQEETKSSNSNSNNTFFAEIPKTTSLVDVPKGIIEQVVGQDAAVDIIKKAALQKRHVLLIGSPGTGKSMLAQGMAELLPKEELEDTLVFPNAEDDNAPVVRTFPAGRGKTLLDAARNELKKAEAVRRNIFTMLFMSVMIITAYYFFIQHSPLILFGGITASVFLLMGMHYVRTPKNAVKVPKLLVGHKKGEPAPFIDATGTHAGALLGDIKHDPFQTGGLETPAHERVEAGCIQKAHKGVLFIDEVANLSRKCQIELLTAMQEKKCAITGRSERSAGAMTRTEPVPCDFVLVAAGNQAGVQRMNPALRSRIRGYGYEVYMNETIPDTRENEELLVRFIAQEVKKDGKIPHFDYGAIAEVIREARRRSGRKNRLTLKLRELGGLIRAAGDVARSEGVPVVSTAQVIRARGLARTLEQQMVDKFIEQKKEYQVILSEGAVVGRVNGLAVVGDSDSGILLPIEAEVTPGGKKQEIVATGRLGEIAKEAIQNVSAIIMKIYGQKMKENFDIYVQFLQTYEGVEGDSASVAVATAIISAFRKIPIDQSVAMTGSLSVRGEVLPVGGIMPKIEAAIGAGMKRVLIPAANAKDVMLTDEQKKRIEVIPVGRIDDVLRQAMAPSGRKGGLLLREFGKVLSVDNDVAITPSAA